MGKDGSEWATVERGSRGDEEPPVSQSERDYKQGDNGKRRRRLREELDFMRFAVSRGPESWRTHTKWKLTPRCPEEPPSVRGDGIVSSEGFRGLVARIRQAKKARIAKAVPPSR